MSILIAVILAFFGGVAATCIGALGSVILCAFVAIIGVCAVMAGCEFNIATQIAFGYFLSPHLGLGPAACALGYAAKKGLVEDSKGIALPLMMLGRPDVYVVWAASSLSLPTSSKWGRISLLASEDRRRVPDHRYLRHHRQDSVRQ